MNASHRSGCSLRKTGQNERKFQGAYTGHFVRFLPLYNKRFSVTCPNRGREFEADKASCPGLSDGPQPDGNRRSRSPSGRRRRGWDCRRRIHQRRGRDPRRVRRESRQAMEISPERTETRRRCGSRVRLLPHNKNGAVSHKHTEERFSRRRSQALHLATHLPVPSAVKSSLLPPTTNHPMWTCV